jgi:hypothetical protein
MEIESNKLKVIFIIVLLIGGIYIYNTTDSKESWVNYLNVIINDEYNGVVIDKYKDISQHNEPIIKLSNDRTVYLSSEEFSKVDKFDSISKSKKSNLLYVFKKDTIIKIDITLGIKERIKEKEKETNH